MQYNTDSHTILRQKIEHVRIGMLTTIDLENNLLSRPMTSQRVDNEGFLWFFVSDEAAVSKQIESNQSVNASFAAPDINLYVSVSGNAEIIKDKETIRSMWSPLVSAWFPGGADNSHVSLIKVQVTSAEYWDSEKSTMMQLALMAKAAVTGEPPTDIGEHKKLAP
jgi:general stress protein 26